MSQVEIHCARCRKLFKPPYSTARYCSRACRYPQAAPAGEPSETGIPVSLPDFDPERHKRSYLAAVEVAEAAEANATQRPGR
jgi:hypothetical protein